MKKNLLGFAAIVLAIAFSSFSVKLTTDLYYFYPGSGSEDNYSIYDTPIQSTPDHEGGTTGSLNWFKVIDDDGQPDQTEFLEGFDELDTNNDGFLSDETEQTGILDRN